jgi:hypothetical protein
VHRTTARFWNLFEEMPPAVQSVAKKNFEILKQNPSHPSLRFKKIGNLWSARAGLGYRALALQEADDFVWFWIGTHDEYERLIKREG